MTPMPEPHVFRQVNAPDPESVTVTIWNEEEGAKGRVTGPSRVRGERVDPYMSPQYGAPEAHEALELGLQVAKEPGVEITVDVARSVWNPDWGELV